MSWFEPHHEPDGLTTNGATAAASAPAAPSGDFSAEIKAVQDYYTEGRPLAERLAWCHERLEEAREAFNEAAMGYDKWDCRYQGTTDHPVSRLVRAIQESVDFTPRPIDLY